MKITIFSIFSCMFLVFSTGVQARPSLMSETPNYAINFKVNITHENVLTPQVEVELRGADEVISMTSLLEEQRYRKFRGDGKILQIGSDIVWKPQSLNGSLFYEVVIPHEREKDKFDSYGKKDWVITRTVDLFPRKRFEFAKAAKSYTTVYFKLPKGWNVAAAMPEIMENKFRAYPTDDTRYDWPTGWLIYGKIRSETVEFRDARITIAYPEAFARESISKDPERINRRQKYLKWFNAKIANIKNLYAKTIPLMVDFLPNHAKDFLVVIGKDPMWQGGLSGERSLYLNRGVPNIVSDKSSTLLHEYFHVCDGFKKDFRDAEWFVEGLAEYYSMRLLFEAELITRKEFQEGIEIHRKKGVWGENFMRSKKSEVHYKSAPVVLYVLDEMIQEKSKGKKSLKNVLTLLAKEEALVGTALFQKTAESIYGDSLETYFKSHVAGGKVPDYQKYFMAD